MRIAAARRQYLRAVPHWHRGRLPATRLHDGCQIDIELQQILCRADMDRVTAHLVHLLRRHPDPPSHPLIDLRDDVGMEPLANPVLPEKEPENRALADMTRCLRAITNPNLRGAAPASRQRLAQRQVEWPLEYRRSRWIAVQEMG